MNTQTSRPAWVMPVVAIVVLLLMVAFMAGAFHSKIEPETQTPEGSVDASMLYQVSLSERDEMESIAASVEAKQDTLISSRIVAQILKVHVRAGDTVKKGQLLLQLEKDDLQARLDQARETIKAVTARLAEAENNYARIQKIHGRKLASDAELDQSLAGRDSLRAELAQAKQSLVEAEAAVGFAEIASPISGRVVDRFAEPGDTAQMGQTLLSIYDPLSLRIEAWVRESVAVTLKVGQSLNVNIPSASDTPYKAVVEEVVPAAEPGSRSFLVKARIGYDEKLLPGLFAQLSVPVATKATVMIPDGYLIHHGQLSLVKVYEGNQVESRYVRLGRTFEDGQVEILGGLEGQEQLLKP